jgi:hypothetical protein
MRHYIALLHKDADSDYGVSFPDLDAYAERVGMNRSGFLAYAAKRENLIMDMLS